METCENCGRRFDTKRSLSYHQRSCGKKPESATVVQSKEPETQDSPELEPTLSDTPTDEEFANNWLGLYEKQEQDKVEQSDDPKKSLDQANSDLSKTKVDNAIELSLEQYIDLYKMFNNILDSIVVALGGNETFSKMRTDTLELLAKSTKTYGDTLKLKLSPAWVFMITFLSAYSFQGIEAANTIRYNRKLLHESGMTPEESRKLQKDIKITPKDEPSL